MLFSTQALQALTPKDLLSIQRGNCVRHRFAKSNCSNCFDICPSKALEWREDGLHRESTKCQGCLLCTASCPSGALRVSEFSPVSLVQELADIEQPVLACSAQSQMAGHARLPCLGALANQELLLAISLALGRTIRLNLSACTDCHNMTVIMPLKKAVKKLAELAIAPKIAVDLVFDQQSLNFKERICSRREFFFLLRSRSKRAGICAVDRLKPESQISAYGTKRLPPARQLLLQVLKQLNRQQKENLFPQRVTGESCRECTGCVGICPTGALQPPVAPLKAPSFEAERCISCRLCESFCPQFGIQIKYSSYKGF